MCICFKRFGCKALFFHLVRRGTRNISIQHLLREWQTIAKSTEYAALLQSSVGKSTQKINLLQSSVGKSTSEQHAPDPPMHERPPHKHAEYGDGEHNQQLVPTNDDFGCCDGCLHKALNWNGEPWPKLHNIGLQIHDSNRRDIGSDSELQSMESIVFGQDSEVSYPSSDFRRILKMIHKSKQVTWYIMATHGSGYRGYQGICNFCGAVMWCAWTPRSTRGWRDHQKANLLAFLGLEVPLSLMRPLEPTLPMV